MRLCFCLECTDLFKIGAGIKSCECGQSGAHFKRDGRTVRFYGPCRIIAAEPGHIRKAAKVADGDERENDPVEQSFTAFVLSRSHPKLQPMTLR